MAVEKQIIEKDYALYLGDCIEIMKDMKNDSIGMSIYSPPFGGLYQYSSSVRDLSNSLDYETFFDHYAFVVKEMFRLTKLGRMSCVHCMDIPKKGDKGYIDFPGDLIRLHEKEGFYFWGRYAIRKEPLRVAVRTRQKSLQHKQIVKDSSLCGNAGSDYLLVFKKKGENKEPIEHPLGFREYCGERKIPINLVNKYKNWKDPKTNKMAHWIWQQYASSFWDDIRINRVLPYRESKEKEEEKHIHPLQLDVVERCLILWSNENDIILSPFMGVGSEVYGAVLNNRKGIGIELKETYFNQAVKNMKDVDKKINRII